MINAWTKFWFATIDARQLAILRILFGSFTVYYLMALLPLTELHFSAEGWLGNARKVNYFNAGSGSLLFELLEARATEIFFFTTIVFAVGFTVGFKTRLCGILTYIALVSIWNRNPFVMDGDDALLRVVVFYLMLSGCGNAWSLDARSKIIASRVEIWPLRLIQFQIALLYFVSGWVKFHNVDWSNGAIFNLVLVHPEYSRWNLSWFLLQPWVQSSLFYLAEFIRCWEILFPILLLHPKSRKLTIVIGAFFHLGLLLFMNLRGFSLIMLTLYLALLPNRYFCKDYAGRVVFNFRRLNISEN